MWLKDIISFSMCLATKEFVEPLNMFVTGVDSASLHPKILNPDTL